jgi:hypothetical protein
MPQEWQVGWLQNLNFFVTATLLAAFVVGVDTAIRLTRFGLLGIAMLMLFIVLGGFAIQEDTPFHEWAGLLQRVLVMVWFACLFVMARRVLRLARESPSPPSTVPG